jgi:rhodanese-related sulfurtransferase|tara:strand:- start:552 stop:935 length:384 start_codon:yes stop_codon:yes gene_type:complete
MNKSIILLVMFFLGSDLDASELWSVEELKSKIDQSSETLVLLDVRTVEEFESGRIRNSINIPHEKLLSNIDLVSEYSNERLIVYCRSGKRADLVINALEKNGFNNIVDIEGDILAWSQSNYPLLEKK